MRKPRKVAPLGSFMGKLGKVLSYASPASEFLYTATSLQFVSRHFATGCSFAAIYRHLAGPSFTVPIRAVGLVRRFEKLSLVWRFVEFQCSRRVFPVKIRKVASEPIREVILGVGFRGVGPLR